MGGHVAVARYSHVAGQALTPEHPEAYLGMHPMAPTPGISAETLRKHCAHSLRGGAVPFVHSTRCQTSFHCRG